MAPPDAAAALQAGIRLARALNSVGVRLRQVDVTDETLQVKATASVEDIDALATLIAEHSGQRLIEPGYGEGVFRAYGAGMRLMAALDPLGIDVHAKGKMTDGRPVVRILATPTAAEELASFLEERRRGEQSRG